MYFYYTPERLVMFLESGRSPERQLLSGLMETLETDLDLGAESIYSVADKDHHDHQQ